MKMVKSLLLGSAAGLVAVAGAQAADLPVKAKAVEYVKVCSLYGAGFYYIPGTDTCIKIGGFVRADYGHNTAGSHAVYKSAADGLYDRGTDVHTTRTRVALSADVRTQTEYGTLRSYLRGGWQWQTDDAVTSNNNVTYFDRGFIQFAGFTFGKTESFFDFYPTPVYSFQTSYLEGSSGGVGINVAAYTAQFGNGVSATISVEDQSFRAAPVVDLAVGGFALVPGAGNVSDRAGQNTYDVVANIRVDQAWGSAQIMGALHENAGTYYAANQNLGHPDSEWGWAAGAGLTLKMPWDAKDTLSLQGVYCEGASRYCIGGGDWSWWRNSNAGFGYADDAYFNTGTGLDLSQSYSLVAAFQHYWTPSLRQSIFAQYANFEANSALVDAAACPVGVSGCADWSAYQIGSRLLWNPVANLDVGVEVIYSKLNSGFGGATTLLTPNGGTAVAVPVGDGDVWSAQFRVQRNFWP